MSQIVKHQQQNRGILISNEIVEASKGIRIDKIIEISPIHEQLTIIVRKCTNEINFNVNELDFEFMINTNLSDLRNDFKDFTIEDVAIAYRKGIRGEFGEFMGISAVSLYKFLKGYKELKKKELILFNRSNPAPLYTEPTQEEITQIRKMFVESIIEKYEAWKLRPTQSILDAGNEIYKTLYNDYKLLIVSPTRKFELLEVARELIAAYYVKNPELTGNELDVLKPLLVKIRSGKATDYVELQITSEAKCLCVIELFKFWNEIDQDVKSTILKEEAEFKQRLNL